MEYLKKALSRPAEESDHRAAAVAAAGMRKKLPNLARPYRAPAVALGALLPALIYLVMMTQLDSNAVLSGLVWALLGLGLYFGYQKYGKAPQGQEEILLNWEDQPSPSEEE